jgi:hypothetical protein
MRNFLKVSLFCLVFLILFTPSSVSANNKVYGLTFMGSQWSLPENESWNVMCWFDSLLKNHRFDTLGYQLDTVINLWDNATQRGYNYSWYIPRYKRPFVTDTASVAKFRQKCTWLASQMDTGDIFIAMMGGHGGWEYWNGEWHSDIQAYSTTGQDQELYDTTVARCFNILPCKLRVIYFWSCDAFGGGSLNPDSSGFATVLAFNAPENVRNKTIFYSHAGAEGLSVQSDNSRLDVPYWNPIPGFENPIYGVNTYSWLEGTFPFECVFDGGIEPSYYSGDSVQPGLYKDSIDLNADNRLSAYEDSVWIHTWSSRLGFSSCPMVDLGGKSRRTIFWPFIGIIDSLDALPTVLTLPDSVDSGAVVIPLARVKNLGFVSANIPTRLRIGTTYNQVRNKTIGPNHEDTLYFPNWTANQSGWKMVRCSTELAGDEKPSNNLLRDSIYVRPPPPVYDAGVTRIILSDTADYGDTLVPHAWVKNFGNQVVSFGTLFRIGSVYGDTKPSGLLNPNDSVELIFDQWVAQTGTYAVKCSTYAINDTNYGNDVKTKTLVVLPPQTYDVGVIRIILPDTVDSGFKVVPQSWVKNFGNQTAAFVTYFRIGSVYSSNRTINNLIPGDSSPVVFDTWPAVPGNYLAKCSTALSGDQNPSNDTLTKNIFVQSIPVFSDVGVTQIFLPDTCDQNDTLSPQARVKNFGDTMVSFSTIFKISAVYNDTVSVNSLKPDSLKLLTFDSWITQSGAYLVKCSTALVNDSNHSNDAQLKTLFVRPPSGAPEKWEQLTDLTFLPKKIKGGAALCYDGNQSIYAVTGNNRKTFLAYDLVAGTWALKESVPLGTENKKVKDGSALVFYQGQVYLIKGNSFGFYCYNPTGNTWSSLGIVPGEKKIKKGSALATDGNWIYLAEAGTKPGEFYKWRPDSGWVSLGAIPPGDDNKKLNQGGSLCYLNGKIYLLKGNCSEFWTCDVASGVWTKDSIIPLLPSNKAKVKYGGSLTVLDGKIYAFKGGNTQDFYEYTSGWQIKLSIPVGTSGRKVKAGGALCGTSLGTLYAFKGNNTYEFWRYTPASGSTFWSSLSPKAQEQSVENYLLRSIVKLPTIIRLSDFPKFQKPDSKLSIYDYLGCKINRINASGIYFLKLENQPMRKILIVK